MKNKNNNQNEFERLGGQRSGGGGYIPPIPPWIRHCPHPLIALVLGPWISESLLI